MNKVNTLYDSRMESVMEKRDDTHSIEDSKVDDEDDDDGEEEDSDYDP